MPDPQQYDAKFGAIGREPSDERGHTATFMVIGDKVIYLYDDDPDDQSLVGRTYDLDGISRDAEWLADE